MLLPKSLILCTYKQFALFNEIALFIKKMLKIIMYYFSDTAKRSFIVFVLFAYIIIPFADSIACSDCTEVCSFQRKQISYVNIFNTDDPALTISNADTQGNSSDCKNDSRCSCPLCYNAVSVFTYDHVILFSALYSVIQPISEVSPEPSFLINKPPRA